VLAAKNVINVHSKSAVASSAGEDPSGGSSGNSTGGSSPSAASPTTPSIPAPTCPTSTDIPSDAKGTWTDVTSWLDQTDFNCTFTSDTVGGLPVAGLNSTWDDSKAANTNVPPLDQAWGDYSKKPFRGVSLGGWLSLEPFITPSLFDAVPGVVDEYTLCTALGKDAAAATLEKHYATFITEDDMKAIAAAGLDHIRIPYSYWAVKVFDGDPYVFGVSWRYLLRGIEWARKYGLRVDLDLHAAPGSQNGWNHSGRQGAVDFITGPDGVTNAQRTLDIHQQLSTFFAQDRYKNIIAFYSLLNEPSPAIGQNNLANWTAEAYKIVNGDAVSAPQVFSDSELGITSWQGKLQGYGNLLVIDVHQYTIFDINLLTFNHTARIAFACGAWVGQMNAGMNPATGFGPVMVGEWSQADTDCAKYLNGVGNGARWNGTYYSGPGTEIPYCPTKDSSCSCDGANAAVSDFSDDYKTFLLTWAQAQMFAFEKGWGWFYWTWKTESAPLWSYQAGLEGGIMPPLAYKRSWDCSMAVPSFGSLPETY
jgi:glucan 1,3-beta-glucosidase